MVNCSVPNCKNTSATSSKNKGGITFHRFPRHKERRRHWEIAVNRADEWISTASSTVCSEHFEPKDFYITESGLRRLSLDAVPTINISACQEPVETVSNVQPANVKSTDSDEVIKLKYKICRLEIVANNRKKTMNRMWQSRRRLKRKLEIMKTLIKHLIENKKETGDTLFSPDFLSKFT